MGRRPMLTWSSGAQSMMGINKEVKTSYIISMGDDVSATHASMLALPV